jgi:hypothetical protein
MNKAKFHCPDCHQSFAAPARVIGKTVRCLACGAQFQAGAVRAIPPPPNAASRVPAPWSDRKVFGIIMGAMLLAALAMCYWGIWQPLEEMKKRQPQVTYSGKAVAMGPLMVVFCIAASLCAAFGRNDAGRQSLPPGHLSRFHAITLAVAALGATGRTCSSPTSCCGKRRPCSTGNSTLQPYQSTI